MKTPSPPKRPRSDEVPRPPVPVLSSDRKRVCLTCIHPAHTSGWIGDVYKATHDAGHRRPSFRTVAEAVTNAYPSNPLKETTLYAHIRRRHEPNYYLWDNDDKE